MFDSAVLAEEVQVAQPRTLEQMAHDRALDLEAWRPQAHQAVHRPVVALSRLPGAGGDEVARRLAHDLSYELYDQQLIHEVAISSRHSERVVATLDECARGQLTEWLTELLTTERFSPHDYRYHLSTVVGALVRRGGAVVVGRGSHLMVDPRQGLRVLVVAPLERRVANVAERRGIPEPEARHVVHTLEEQRRRFLKTHFRAELADPTSVDLVLNTDALGIERAVLVVKAAVEARGIRAGGMS
jgi:cytidylate kinase